MASEGKAFAVAGGGALLVWSAMNNRGVLATLADLIRGTRPTPGPNQFNAPTTTTQGDTLTTQYDSNAPLTGDNAAQRNANRALGKQLAAAYGWDSGAEWDAFNAVVMQESGWDSYAANPSSDARGIAQNINGWSSDYQPGNAAQQIQWMLAYIKQRYGDPIAAEKFHLANNWY